MRTVCRYIGLAILLSLGATAQANNVSFNDAVKSLKGSKIQALINRWGIPDGKITGSSGHILYIYDVRTYGPAQTGPTQPATGVHVGRNGSPVIVNEPNPTQAPNRGMLSLTCRTVLDVNEAGTILAVQTEGNGCDGDARVAEQYLNSRK